MILALATLAFGAALAAQAPPVASPVPQDAALNAEFVKLEREMMDARVRYADPANAEDGGRSLAELEGFLAPEYMLTMSSRPAQPIGRADWLARARRYPIQEFRQRDLVARRLGHTVVTSLAHRQRAGVGAQQADRSGELWLVDIWRRVDGRWRVASRYSGKVEEAKGGN